MSADTSEPQTTDRRPANVVVVLLDSLNRHLLGCYGGTEYATPNLDRFAAERATRFTRHVTGSLPCMPARHDILVGSMDFLWRPWGSIELWEQPITVPLRAAGVTTFLASDHPHLFETGGENYHCDFTAWDYVRGHEGDPWRTFTDATAHGAPDIPPAAVRSWFEGRRGGSGLPRIDAPYDRSRTHFRDEMDFPGPRTMHTAARFVREAAPHHDRWFLFVDEFDPHEPFDTPQPWAGRYDDEPWDGEYLIWPPYAVGALDSGQLSEREGRHIRNNYGAKLSMIDHHLGRLLDTLDEAGRWDDTAVIVCTDHGHYLGERREGGDIWGKPGVPQYEPIGHTPLLVAWPGVEGGGTCDALTTNVDLHATIADVFGASGGYAPHGTSLVPLLTGGRTTVRDWALGGVYGGWVQVTDGTRKYIRAPEGTGYPLSMWSNRWSTMPVHGLEDLAKLPPPDSRARLDRMPGSEIPVIRQPFEPGDALPFWASSPRIAGRHALYDLGVDPDEQENRCGERVEHELAELLRAALLEVEAPDDQLARLGL